jgi:putative CRISPR-associated protein (TIGR02620 family)
MAEPTFMKTKITVVTRHPALVALLRERGLVSDDVRIIAHATPEDVAGQHVIGVLPLALAALAASVTEIPLNLTPEMRGKELDIETLRQIAGAAVQYTVKANS